MSSVKKSDFSVYEKKDLVVFVSELQEKLNKKKLELQSTREKLRFARKRLLRAKESVEYQRNRIIELSGERLPSIEQHTKKIEAISHHEQRSTINQ